MWRHLQRVAQLPHPDSTLGWITCSSTSQFAQRGSASTSTILRPTPPTIMLSMSPLAESFDFEEELLKNCFCCVEQADLSNINRYVYLATDIIPKQHAFK